VVSDPQTKLGDATHQTMQRLHTAPVETPHDQAMPTVSNPYNPDGSISSILSPLPADTFLVTSKPNWPFEETQNPYTGWIGVGALLFGAVATALIPKTPDLPLLNAIWNYRFAFFTGLVLVAMAVYELAWVKVYRRHFDFSAPRSMDSAAWKRVVKRCMALYACITAVTFLYVFLGEYNFWNLYDYARNPQWYYSHFRHLFLAVVPTVGVLCWPYFYAVECYGKSGEDDEFLILSNWISRPWSVIRSGQPAQRDENAHVANLARGLLVNFFFIPVMVSFCFGNWGAWEYRAHFVLNQLQLMDWNSTEAVSRNLRNFAKLVFSFILLVDVCNGLVGYIGSCRLLDTHVVSAEPTMFGWVIALLCYPPIQPVITGVFLEYSLSDIWPVDMFQHYPVFSLVMTTASLALMGIYAWATIAFGLRFSNLTNRGLICSGPYAYVRHPAYICKNLSWWIDALPAILGHPQTIPLAIVRMLATNTIYTMRALTEERHLMREIHYREYCKKVPWRFIPGLW
jgi:protein-S-isoprenylcysteine O-methyltransferase Ste14